LYFLPLRVTDVWIIRFLVGNLQPPFMYITTPLEYNYPRGVLCE